MTDPARPPAGGPLPVRSPSVLAASLETTAGSFVHYVFRLLNGVGGGRAFAVLALYVIAVAIGYLPLLVAALKGPLPLFSRWGQYSLPFFFDLTMSYALLISLPCLAILFATDEDVLVDSLERVQSDGAITIRDEDAARLAADWKGRFRLLNLVAQAVGVMVGGLVVWFNDYAYARSGVGLWIVNDKGDLLAVGVVYLYSVFLLYALIAVFVARNICIFLLFTDIVAHSELHMIPMHPDKAGGLRPVGRLGLRNQYAITFFGFNVLILLIVYPLFLKLDVVVVAIMGAALGAYLILGPIVFMAPLLPFREKMRESKNQLMSEIALRMRGELNRIRLEVPEGVISKEDEELVERLRKIGTLIDELPVWPFDVGTLRRFLTAYIIPILIPIVSAAYAVANAVAPTVTKLIDLLLPHAH